MRCLVSGADGFIGSFLTKRLLEDGNEVAVLVKGEGKRIDGMRNQVYWIRGAMETPDSYIKQIKEFEPEVVFHLAWFGVTKDFRDDPRQFTVNVFGSIRLFEACLNSMKTFIGLGSQAEYGFREGRMVEERPARPITLYGIAKDCVRRAIQRLSALQGVRFAWLRLFSCYGPDSDESYLIPYVIRNLLKNNPLHLTSGNQRWDYLYVEDVAEAIIKAGKCRCASGIMNLCSGEAKSIKEIVTMLRDMINPQIKLTFGEIQGEEQDLIGDPTRIRLLTGFIPRFSLEEGMAKTIEWYTKKRS